MKKALAVVLFLACGSPVPVSRCGALVIGQTADYEQNVEDIVEKAFQHSPDARLHAVCKAMDGWTIVAEDKVFAQGPGPGGISSPSTQVGQQVGGDSINRTHTTYVKTDLSTLPHEMAHIAQFLDDDSVIHKNWETDVYPVLDLVASGACDAGCP